MEMKKKMVMTRKEAIAVLESIKREKEQDVRYPGFNNKHIISEWFTQIKALTVGIDELQITIDNQ